MSMLNIDIDILTVLPCFTTMFYHGEHGMEATSFVCSSHSARTLVRVRI